MTIDEVIEQASNDAGFYINQLKSLRGEGYVISDVAMKQINDAIKYNESIVRLLGELKILRRNSCMIHLPERLQLVENGYNKALDDVEREFLKCDKVHYNLQDILNVLNKVKAGETNGIDNK